MVFDPIQRSQEVESIVMRGDARRYYRFRHAYFYDPGGIVTADALGCNLKCSYCWNRARNETLSEGSFYRPFEVALKLRDIAKKHNCNLYRLSGAEPFLGEDPFNHVVKVIEAIPDGNFWIETNGIYLGAHPAMIKDLPDNIQVRICVKGQDARQFSEITGACEEDFRYQVMAVKALKRSGIKYIMAIAKNIVDPEILGYSLPYEDFEYETIRQYSRSKKS